jgi:hypothetical protein
MMPIGARFVVSGKVAIDLPDSYWFKEPEGSNTPNTWLTILSEPTAIP